MLQDTHSFVAPTPTLPHIYDDEHVVTDMPRALGPWKDAARPDICASMAKLAGQTWRFPTRPVIFISDPHADAEALLRSLIAAGAIRRANGRILLTEFGQHAQIILGGDYLDKGPSDLALLDTVAALRALGARMILMAGNHDLRMLMLIHAVHGPRTPLNEHLFLRMGRKVLPAMAEILAHHVSAEDLAAMPSEDACRAQLLPAPDWAARFAQAAHGRLRPELIADEIDKLSKKQASFTKDTACCDLTARQILAAARKCRDLFLDPEGKYGWFFPSLTPLWRDGAFLFIHAGLCDQMATTIAQNGTEGICADYHAEAATGCPEFYFGPLGNLLRTKYRKNDGVLSPTGVRALHNAGIHMVVQGHVGSLTGQRLRSHTGLMHLQGDVTLDRFSRARDGADGIGAGATLIFPSGDVIGLSRDHPHAKHLRPAQMQTDRTRHENLEQAI